MKNKGYIFLSLISVLICITAVIFFMNLDKFTNSGKEDSEVKLELICEKVSPDKGCKAVMFSVITNKDEEVCYQLSIVPVENIVTEKDTANVFSYDGIYDIEWQDENTLLVKKYEEGTDYYKVEEYNAIKIKYLSPAETREYEKNK